MFETVNEDVHRIDNRFISVHGYQIRATLDQEERIKRLTVEQRMQLLVMLSVIRSGVARVAVPDFLTVSRNHTVLHYVRVASNRK
jgi:hypothetical protein